MKVKALSRSKASTQRECVGDLRKHARNLDPVYHPMQRPREMARAVTSAKMERMVRHTIHYDIGQIPAVGRFLFLTFILLVHFVPVSIQSLPNHLWGTLAMVTKTPSIIPLFHENRYCHFFQGAQTERFLCGICPRVHVFLP